SPLALRIQRREEEVEVRVRPKHYLFNPTVLKRLLTQVSSPNLPLNLSLQVHRIRGKNELSLKGPVSVLSLQNHRFVNRSLELYPPLGNLVLVRPRRRYASLLRKPVIIPFNLTPVLNLQKIPRTQYRNRILVLDNAATLVSTNINRKSPVRNLHTLQVDKLVNILDYVRILVKNQNGRPPIATLLDILHIIDNAQIPLHQPR